MFESLTKHLPAIENAHSIVKNSFQFVPVNPIYT